MNLTHPAYFFKNGLITILITLFAVAAATFIARDYFSIAPFHYDSASYLSFALSVHDVVSLYGKKFAVIHIMQSKDILDVVLRVLFAPDSLKTVFGHMVISIPFMALFIFLVIHYVYRATQSWMASLIAIGFLFTFPLMYMPYMGIADYWKESIAIWILGCAVMSWILSDGLKNSGWAFFCSILFGLLCMERAVLGIYIGVLFIPVFCAAVYQRFKLDGAKKALCRVSIFLIPIVLSAAMLAFIQWEFFYIYYFTMGYSYSSSWEVGRYIFNDILYDAKHSSLLVWIFLCGIFWHRISHYRDIFTALWLTVGFPFVVIFTHGLYFYFYHVWTILLVISLTTIIAGHHSLGPSAVRSHRYFMPILLMIVIICGCIQFFLDWAWSKEHAKLNASWRVLYENISHIILQQSKPRYYSLLFFEASSGPFTDHLRLNKMAQYDDAQYVGYMSVHDSFYKVHAPADNTLSIKDSFLAQLRVINDPSAEDIAKDNIKQMEKHDGTIAITYCHKDQIAKSSVFGADSMKIAIPTVVLQTNYLLNSLNWIIIGKLDSPVGCLYVYQYSKNRLTKNKTGSNA
jgi:hypothetical protein